MPRRGILVMAKIDIFSGFLGAGKTTLIKKLIKEAYAGERVVLIENEFGEIGIDGGFLQDAGIEITEMNSGCICCSLVGDFTKALLKVIEEYNPERIIIEPSGVGKLSDIIKAVQRVDSSDAVLNCFTTVCDAGKCKMYMKNFGEFYNDQITYASAIVLSHTDKAPMHKVEEAVALIREHNSTAVIITTPIDKLSGKDILTAMESRDNLDNALKLLEEEHKAHHEHEHHHHHHEHDENCDCGCHEHHEHHHEHDEHCSCGCHEHGHHHADEVFESIGVETARKFSEDDIRNALDAFDEDADFGMVLRAKGIVEATEGDWIHFDYVPGDIDIRRGGAGIIGRLCVIGSGLDSNKVKAAFGL